MAERLFGTDGVRGRAGEYPLDPGTVARIGAAVVRSLSRQAGGVRLLVGRDTRESGGWIERELARGAGSAGANVTTAGVIPTPAVAYLTRALGFDAGIVISASHNPYEDNGIKVFSGAGEKLDEALERHVEERVADTSWAVPGDAVAAVESGDLVGDYLAHARAALTRPEALAGMRIAIDCANGATTTAAPRLFGALGFDVTVLHATPDGRNINRGCGSTAPQSLMKTVVDGGFRAGVAFDGDGDRALLVDHTGRLVDGDNILLMCAKELKRRGQLKGDAVVATVMSNIGLELAFKEAGISLLRTPVGDKHVAALIAERGLSLGGEQSGHIIFSDFLFTGDGLVTALSVLDVMASTGRELAALAAELVTYPQVLVNVRVRERKDLGGVAPVAGIMEEIEQRLAGHGRLLVRYSGTEPLLRIMLEGRDQREIEAWAREIASVVQRELGEARQGA